MEEKKFRSHINFQIMAKLFFDLAEERYPSSEKVNQLASRLVNPMTTDKFELIYLKIGLLNAMRNMVKEVSPSQLYRSIQHRDELFQAIIEALEELEDELEELEEDGE
jgi:type III secretion protein W